MNVTWLFTWHFGNPCEGRGTTAAPPRDNLERHASNIHVCTLTGQNRWFDTAGAVANDERPARVRQPARVLRVAVDVVDLDLASEGGYDDPGAEGGGVVKLDLRQFSGRLVQSLNFFPAPTLALSNCAAPSRASNRNGVPSLHTSSPSQAASVQVNSPTSWLLLLQRHKSRVGYFP